MTAQLLTERYHDRLLGTLSCYDRMVITGTLPGVCYAEGMTSFLKARGIRIFDYTCFAEPLRERVRTRAQELAGSAGIEVEFIAKAHIRKEEVVARVLEARGDRPGLVHVLSAMEACTSYRPWHDKSSGKTSLKQISWASWGVIFLPRKVATCSAFTAKTAWRESCSYKGPSMASERKSKSVAYSTCIRLQW